MLETSRRANGTMYRHDVGDTPSWSAIASPSRDRHIAALNVPRRRAFVLSCALRASCAGDPSSARVSRRESSSGSPWVAAMISPRRRPSASVAGRSSGSTPISQPDHRQSCMYASESSGAMRMPSCRSPSSTTTEKRSEVPSSSCWSIGAPHAGVVPPPAPQDHPPHLGVDEAHVERELPADAVRPHPAGRDRGLHEPRGLAEPAPRLLLEAAAEHERLVAAGRRVAEHQRLHAQDDPAERAGAHQHGAAAIQGLPVDPHGDPLDLCEEGAQRLGRAGGAGDASLRRLPEERPARPGRHGLDGLDDGVGGRVDARQVRAQAVDAIAEAPAGGARVQEP